MDALLGVPPAARARAAAVLAQSAAGTTVGGGDAALAGLLDRALAAWGDGGGADGTAGAPASLPPRAPLHTVVAGGAAATVPPPQLPQAPARAAAASAAAQAGWDVLHAGSWRDVPPSSRSLYAAAALLEVAADVAALVEQQSPQPAPPPLQLPHGGRATLRRCLRTLDVALMLGTPRDRPALFAAVAAVEAALAAATQSTTTTTTTTGGLQRRDGASSAAAAITAAAAREPQPPPPPPVPAGAIEVPRLQLPSLAAFYSGYMCYRPATSTAAADAACAGGGSAAPAATAGEGEGGDDDLRSVYEPGNASSDGSCEGGGGPPLGRPVVIAGALAGWPALRKWGDPAYLAAAAGHRTVPVEVGGHYMSAGWGQRLMSLRGFLRSYAGGGGGGSGSGADDSSSDDDEVVEEGGGDDDGRDGAAAASGGGAFGYLAQHPLFDQVPALRADIGPLPDYCSLTPPQQQLPATAAAVKMAAEGSDVGGGEPATKRARGSNDESSAAAVAADGDADAADDNDNEDYVDDDDGWGGVTVNAWLGPPGTVSCLHWDRPHNLLAQVVGCKRVLLVDPRHGGRVYAHPGLMGNTARVDPEVDGRLPPTGAAAATAAAATADGAAAATFPRFPGTPLYVATLGPGDALYIPPMWWHHVRALSRSFSVSLWWGAS
jgi:hypothetical protein